MNILITGAAGFIGSEIVNKLLARNSNIIGVDNHNDYYDTSLKDDRVKRYVNNEKYTHYKVDISQNDCLEKIFKKHNPNIVINMAAQAGVRYSLQNPEIYIKSNINGFANILECCKKYNVSKLIYASSSSVYGINEDIPYKENGNTDKPLSLYAATKKSNELMAYSYSSLFGIKSVGLRLFTVYGPWGRPDMSLYKFTELITQNKPIEVFDNGEHKRDFTYIDDVVKSVIKLVDETSENEDSAEVYNIGNSSLVDFNNYINLIEKNIGKKAEIIYLPRQNGDMKITYADNSKFYNNYKIKPEVSIEQGVKSFVEWYKSYKKI